MTTLLAIDTAGPQLQVALWRDGTTDLLAEEMPQGQAERLFPAIAELLARSGLGYAGLDRVAVTTGPGSFTGVRIGLSAARGLGLALAVPVVGVPSLVALSLAAACDPVAVVLEARRGEAYVQTFSGPGIPVSGPRLVPKDEVQRLVPPGGAVLTGPVPDMERLAAFAAAVDPVRFPPDATYVRDADAKPQEKFRVARAGTAA